MMICISFSENWPSIYGAVIAITVTTTITITITIYCVSGQPAECDCSLCGPYDHLVWEMEGATMDRYIEYIVFKDMFIEFFFFFFFFS